MMLQFPKSTEFNKRIPKEKFYSVGSFSPKDKNAFINDIDKIIWSNKISEKTSNFSAGKEIGEIEVITLYLKQKEFTGSIINIIQKTIPYKTVFNIVFENEIKLAVYQTKLYQTEWQPIETADLVLTGIDLDAVWSNIVKNIAGGEWDNELSLAENLAQKEKREKIKKEIDRLEKQARNEKQPKKKFEIVQQIKTLKNQL